MATTTISLTEEAYESLKALKRPDESFSDVVERLTGAEQDKMAGFGVWTDESLSDAIEEYRAEFERDFEDRINELS